MWPNEQRPWTKCEKNSWDSKGSAPIWDYPLLTTTCLNIFKTTNHYSRRVRDHHPVGQNQGVVQKRIDSRDRQETIGVYFPNPDTPGPPGVPVKCLRYWINSAESIRVHQIQQNLWALWPPADSWSPSFCPVGFEDSRGEKKRFPFTVSMEVATLWLVFLIIRSFLDDSP